MKSTYISIHYKETEKSKKWIDKHIGRNKQSDFIRSAVAEKIYFSTGKPCKEICTPVQLKG